MEKTNIITKPPVVVVLGHIDHGKSSLLEAIRKDLKITPKESGGITQHIGAYEAVWNQKLITFIDTPGHEAFSQMRSRGAKAADIAVLVVDVTEGVKEQTKEAIEVVKKAGIPLVVALNKIDKPGANPQIVKEQLARLDVLVESLGGKVPCVETSAKTGQGIEELLDLINLIAEIEDLKVDISLPCLGFVIESYLDRKKGPLATLILSQGVLKKNDILATPTTYAKVRNLFDFKGEPLDEVLPGRPVLVLGFEKCPVVGQQAKVFESLEEARNYIREEKKIAQEVILENLPNKIINLILKTDCLGSLEAISEGIKKINQKSQEISDQNPLFKIVKSEVGDINDSDIKFAQSTQSIVIGFRVKIDKTTKTLASRFGVKVKKFEIIYELFEEIEKIKERLLAPKTIREDLAKMKVLVIFLTEKKRQIVGGRVIEGKIERGTKIEIIRGEEKIGTGRLINLQIDKKDVSQAPKGKECGILYEGETKIEEGDILVFFKEKKEKTNER